ncbi:MAG: PQQ-binding-like beta-propeller repeat protein [Propionibacteriaceae bacterium]|nr:PQQ-binding-like beta-propeller repeat protein [Propionibacteriaceae bacterium]
MEYDAEQQRWAGSAAGMLLFQREVAPGESLRVTLLDWEDGKEKWSVDLGPRVNAHGYVAAMTELKDGHVGFHVGGEDGDEDGGEDSGELIVLRVGDGAVEHVVPAPLGTYHELPSGGVYRVFSKFMDGNSTIARFTSFDDFTQEWELDLDYDAHHHNIGLTEHDSTLEVCSFPVVGDAKKCKESIDLATGKRAEWLPSPAVFQTFGNKVLVMNPDTGDLRGYEGGEEKWRSDLGPSEMGHDLYSMNGAALVESGEELIRIDPSTGEEKWRMVEGEGLSPRSAESGDKAIMVGFDSRLTTGVLNLASGELEKSQEHEGQDALLKTWVTESKKVVTLRTGREGQGVELTGLEPGVAELQWRASFPEYDFVDDQHGHLVVFGENRIGVLQ